MLDGDDWWSDENKLQMQVKLLEENPTYSFCYTRGGIYNEKKRILNHSESMQKPSGDIFSTMIHNYQILNGTVMHRVAFLKNIDWEELLSYELLYLDYPTNVMMAAQGPVGYIDKETYIWRRGIASVTAPDSWQKAYAHINTEVNQGLFLKSKYPKTSYDIPLSAIEEFKLWRMYEDACRLRNYNVIQDVLSRPNFPIKRLYRRPETKYLRYKILFLFYIYVVKRLNTLLSLLYEKKKNIIHHYRISRWGGRESTC